jgi:hypothetical protein
VLAELGRRSGKTAEQFLRALIEGEILSRQPFSEILEPIRSSFDASGMSEHELDQLLQEAREEVAQGKSFPKHG